MDTQLIEKYTKTYGKRFGIMQKKKAAQQLIKDMEQYDYPCEVMKKRKGLSHCTNYFFGDKANVKTIIAIPFDTPERKFWYRTKYFPLDGTLSNKKNTLPTYGPIMLVYLIVLLALTLFGKYLKGTAYANYATTALFLFILFMAYALLQGFGNKHNVNRNSASILMALRLASSLQKDEKREVGFLFLDANRGNYLGADSASKTIEEEWHKSVEVILLNCISVGKDLVIGYNPANRKRAQEVLKYHPEKKELPLIKLSDTMLAYSAMFFFKRAIIISSGELEDDGLLVKNTGTSKDKEMNEERMEEIYQMILGFLKSRIMIRRK